MSLVAWREEARDADGTIETIDLSGDASRVFVIITNSPSDNMFVVAAFGVLPSVGSFLPGTFTYTCRRLRFRRMGRYSWIVTAEYSTRNETAAAREAQVYPNPVDRPVQIRWFTSSIVRVADKNSSDRAILNSAGDSFDPPCEREDYFWCVQVTQNFDTIPPGILSYAGAVNATACVIDGVTVAKEAARIKGIEISEQQYENDFGFRQLQIVYEMRDVLALTHTDGNIYDLRTLDQGYNYLDSGVKKRIQVDNPQAGTDGEPDKIDSPVPLPLDGSGAVLSIGATEKYRPNNLYARISYAGLPGVA